MLIPILFGMALGAHCWWLGIAGFSYFTEEDDARPGITAYARTWQCWTGLIPLAVIACGFYTLGLAALSMHLAINAYVYVENKGFRRTQFIHS